MRYQPGPHTVKTCQDKIATWTRRLAVLTAAGYGVESGFDALDADSPHKKSQSEYDADMAWFGVMGALVGLRQSRRLFAQQMVKVWQAELAVAVARECPEEVARA